MTIQKDKVASIEYTLKGSDGEVIDASSGNPLPYIHGHMNLVPGLEKELEGKSVGDKFSTLVPAAEGYGEVNEEFIQVVPVAMFQGVDELAVGMQFQASGPEGQAHSVHITKIDGDDITVDGNHPLAGKDLAFDIEVVDLRDATPEELDHGHVHGEGGHSH